MENKQRRLQRVKAYNKSLKLHAELVLNSQVIIEYSQYDNNIDARVTHKTLLKKLYAAEKFEKHTLLFTQELQHMIYITLTLSNKS